MADDGAVHEMSRVIGSLEASVIELNRKWDERERSASEGRRVLHAKFDSLKDEVSEMATKVVGVETALASIEPEIKTFQEARLQAIGAQKLGKWIWWVLLGVAGAAGSMITWVLSWMGKG